MKEEGITMKNKANKTIEFKEKSFCITGAFSTLQKDGKIPLTRTMISELVVAKGGIIKKTVIKSLDYLVIGGAGSDRYKEGTKGSKYTQAQQQPDTKIISEEELLDALGY